MEGGVRRRELRGGAPRHQEMLRGEGVVVPQVSAPLKPEHGPHTVPKDGKRPIEQRL